LASSRLFILCRFSVRTSRGEAFFPFCRKLGFARLTSTAAVHPGRTDISPDPCGQWSGTDIVLSPRSRSFWLPLVSLFPRFFPAGNVSLFDRVPFPLVLRSAVLIFSFRFFLRGLIPRYFSIWCGLEAPLGPSGPGVFYSILSRDSGLDRHSISPCVASSALLFLSAGFFFVVLFP